VGINEKLKEKRKKKRNMLVMNLMIILTLLVYVSVMFMFLFLYYLGLSVFSLFFFLATEQNIISFGLFLISPSLSFLPHEFIDICIYRYIDI